MKLADFQNWIDALSYGKRLPTAVYIARPSDWTSIPSELAATIERGMIAANPEPSWNLLKLHTDQFAITFLAYPEFDTDPHPALAQATKIHMGTGSVALIDYRKRANPPILHRKEAFLPPDDPRHSIFSELTKQEEAAGLYRDPSRIGLRVHWITLLKRLRLTHEEHMLVALPADNHSPVPLNTQPEVERHRTAIKRYDLSKPVKMALQQGLLRQRDRFFDYGCGHGMDMEALDSLGYTATGWDPTFRPNAIKEQADFVNLGYVLNVIENPVERLEALRGAWDLTERVLLVSTLVAGQETDAHSRPLGDGYLTKSNTFQKFYAPGELENLIETTLGGEVATVGFGICAVFRNPDDAEAYEASRSRRRIDWTQISTLLKFSAPASTAKHKVDRYALHKELLDSFWTCLLELGRLPKPGEFDRLAEVKRLGRGLARTASDVIDRNGKSLWDHSRSARAEDVLVYLAMTNFRKRFLQREIPLRTKNDIKAFFGDIKTAQTKARELLFAAGDPDEVALAVEKLNFGYFDESENQFTFHRSFLDQMPAILRVYVYCAAIRYGDPAEADLIKIHVRSGKLTFLHYDDFEDKEKPLLETRIKINLRNQFVQVFDHSHEKQLLLNKRQFASLETS